MEASAPVVTSKITMNLSLAPLTNLPCWLKRAAKWPIETSVCGCSQQRFSGCLHCNATEQLCICSSPVQSNMRVDARKHAGMVSSDRNIPSCATAAMELPCLAKYPQLIKQIARFPTEVKVRGCLKPYRSSSHIGSSAITRETINM